MKKFASDKHSFVHDKSFNLNRFRKPKVLRNMNLKRIMSVVRCLLTTIVFFNTFGAWAGSEVHVETAGTLSSLLTTTERELKITGAINGTDVKYLRELIDAGTVTILDLSEVNIVKGGSAYFTDDAGKSYKTENNIIGQSCVPFSCRKTLPPSWPMPSPNRASVR